MNFFFPKKGDCLRITFLYLHIKRQDWGTRSWSFIWWHSQWSKRKKELMSIILNKSDCGKEKKSEVGKRWVHKEYAKGMSKAWKSKCRDLVQLSEAALRCQLTDETTCLHGTAGEGRWVWLQAHKRAAVLRKNHLDSRSLQVGLCGKGFTDRFQTDTESQWVLK